MPSWYESIDEDFKTLSTSVPNEYAALVRKHKGSKTVSRYIRELIEADIDTKEQAEELSDAESSAA